MLLKIHSGDLRRKYKVELSIATKRLVTKTMKYLRKTHITSTCIAQPSQQMDSMMVKWDIDSDVSAFSPALSL